MVIRENMINIIRKAGGSRILAVTKIIPPDFNVVSVDVLKVDAKSVTIKIVKVG